MQDLLLQQGIQITLMDKSKNHALDDHWDDLDARALSSIHLCLMDEFLIQHRWRSYFLIRCNECVE